MQFDFTLSSLVGISMSSGCDERYLASPVYMKRDYKGSLRFQKKGNGDGKNRIRLETDEDGQHQIS